MKIGAIHLNHMRNNEHFKFCTDVCSLIKRIGAAALKIEEQFATFVTLFEDEDMAVNKIRMSATTLEINHTDKERDSIFRGMVDAYKSSLNHFDEQKAKAAKRLKPVFDTYGNIAIKPLNEQSSNVINMIQEFTGKYAADCQIIGITDWVLALAACNDTMINLMHSRINELATRTDIVTQEARAKVDEGYRVIVERINALVIIEGVENYEAFIRKLNTIIAKYSATMARRCGKASKKAKSEKSKQQKLTV